MTISHDISAVLGLESYLEASEGNTRRAAAMALNDVIGGPAGLGIYRREANAQINFPAGYLNDQRFGMDQRATPTRLVASLIARQRPTSLARFATSGAIGAKGGVAVKVKRNGSATLMKNAFLVRLRAGTSLENGNVGLAVRLEPGQTLNKRDASRMVHLDANVVLLYGPSIDQILNNDVAESSTPEVIDNVATEFYRQFARLSDER